MGGAVSAGEDNDELIDNLVEAEYIKTPHVEQIFRAVDRGYYYLDGSKETAYRDLAWKHGNIHLSAPCIYSEVMESLKLQHGMSFLNLGSGTGYLSTMAGLVLGTFGVNHGIELHSEVVDYARSKLEEFQNTSPALDKYEFCPPSFVVGNCLLLDSSSPQYDRVYCGASCPSEHENYIKNLVRVGGILVMPLNDHLLQVTRTGELTFDVKNVLPVSFASLVVPNSSETRNFIKLPEKHPLPLQEICRSTIRVILRANAEAENPSLKDKKKSVPTKRRKSKRRIRKVVIPVFDETRPAVAERRPLDELSGPILDENSVAGDKTLFDELTPHEQNTIRRVNRSVMYRDQVVFNNNAVSIGLRPLDNDEDEPKASSSNCTGGIVDYIRDSQVESDTVNAANNELKKDGSCEYEAETGTSNVDNRLSNVDNSSSNVDNSSSNVDNSSPNVDNNSSNVVSSTSNVCKHISHDGDKTNIGQCSCSEDCKVVSADEDDNESNSEDERMSPIHLSIIQSQGSSTLNVITYLSSRSRKESQTDSESSRRGSLAKASDSGRESGSQEDTPSSSLQQDSHLLEMHKQETKSRHSTSLKVVNEPSDHDYMEVEKEDFETMMILDEEPHDSSAESPGVVIARSSCPRAGKREAEMDERDIRSSYPRVGNGDSGIDNISDDSVPEESSSEPDKGNASGAFRVPPPKFVNTGDSMDACLAIQGHPSYLKRVADTDEDIYVPTPHDTPRHAGNCCRKAVVFKRIAYSDVDSDDFDEFDSDSGKESFPKDYEASREKSDISCYSYYMKQKINLLPLPQFLKMYVNYSKPV